MKSTASTGLKFFCLLAIISISFNSSAQNDTLTNALVLDLHQNGFSKSLIIDKINTSVCNFDLSTAKLIQLKKAKLPEDVISEMLKRTGNSSPGQPVVSVTRSESTRGEVTKSGYAPPQNLPSGIYYHNKVTNELLELDPSVYSQAKSGSGILTSLTYGFAKTKSSASLRGVSANFQIKSDTFPTFYFYFDKNRKNDLGGDVTTGGWYSTASTPNEFTLVKLVVPKKGSTREVVTGSYNIEGGTSGIAEEQNFGYKYDKVVPGIYRVYFPNGIRYGEYGFMYAGTETANKVYDFGVAK